MYKTEVSFEEVSKARVHVFPLISSSSSSFGGFLSHGGTPIWTPPVDPRNLLHCHATELELPCFASQRSFDALLSTCGIVETAGAMPGEVCHWGIPLIIPFLRYLVYIHIYIYVYICCDFNIYPLSILNSPVGVAVDVMFLHASQQRGQQIPRGHLLGPSEGFVHSVSSVENILSQLHCSLGESVLLP